MLLPALADFERSADAVFPGFVRQLDSFRERSVRRSPDGRESFLHVDNVEIVRAGCYRQLLSGYGFFVTFRTSFWRFLPSLSRSS